MSEHTVTQIELRGYGHVDGEWTDASVALDAVRAAGLDVDSDAVEWEQTGGRLLLTETENDAWGAMGANGRAVLRALESAAGARAD